MSTPRIVAYDDRGFVLENDPTGIATRVIDALISRQGADWTTALVSGDNATVQLGPSLRAQRISELPVRLWTFTHVDGKTLTLSGDDIDQLTDLAWDFRRLAPTKFPTGSVLSGGRFEISECLHGTPNRGLFRGIDHETSNSVLVTLAGPQRDTRETLLRRFAYDIAGISKVLHIGALTGDGNYVGLVETEPTGVTTTSSRAPLRDIAACKRTLAAARIVAEAHAAGHVLVGLRPELVYIDGDNISGLAPRCEPFVMGAKRPDYGVMDAFPNLYMAPEILMQVPNALTPAADVFSLCAMLAFWVSGEHPYAQDDVPPVMAIMQGTRRPLNVSAQIAPILDNGLVTPDRRMTLQELIDILVEIY